jgi:octaprenyl-diphosphate synthase
VSAATKTVCSGEILQTLRKRTKVCTRDEYFRVLQMKTAELFALSCDLGGWLGGADPRQRAALRRYGMELGIAYQVYDDCVDLFGSEAAAGKSLGTDLASGKLTLPVLVALERASAEEAAELRELISNWNGTQEQTLRRLLETQGALAASCKVIHTYLDSATRQLKALAPSPHRDALAALPKFLAKQTLELGA